MDSKRKDEKGIKKKERGGRSEEKKTSKIDIKLERI